MNQSTVNTIKSGVPVLLVSVCIIATCGILYELLISTISAYLLGSSVLHFSLTIGLFLSFMGLGAYLSKFFSDKYLLDYFILVEIWLGIIGGLSGAMLYVAYSMTENYYLIAFLLISTIGTLIGLEIPLLTRIIRQYFSLRDTLAQVLSFDYLGALVASVLFPLFFLPYFGLMRTSFLIGLLNLAVGIFNLMTFKNQLYYFRTQLGLAFAMTSLYGFGFYYSFSISGYLEQLIYQDEIVLSKQSPYQRIVLTQWQDDIRLYINENLQFCSVDEYRYHEPLIHVPMSLHPNPEKVLILGGGDGLAVREILKYPQVQEIHLVDLDKEITDLAKNYHVLKKLNQASFLNPKVKIFHEDAFKFVEKAKDLYQVVIVDLPDAHEISLGKLYSKEFYAFIDKKLARDGVLVTQATSPYFARKSFWCIHHTLESVFPKVEAYTVHVPSFGQWGFSLAMKYPMKQAGVIQKIRQNIQKPGIQGKLRFLKPEMITSLFVFDPDMSELPTEINTLNTQKLIQYYEEGWKAFNE
ncbi:MAG: polyamine aminopropyltransferase [Microscillaceae bacterium]|nr:polyamine aminopropyltransferase [Microscillaceae bacterium]